MRLVAFLFFSSLALAQQPASTSGSCSPIAPANTGSITINCPGMSKEQGDKMLAILNKILANQLDPNVVLAKLDEIEKDVKGLKRGVYSGYDFNGVKRDVRPGFTSAAAGEEFSAFQRMRALEAEHRWTELLDTAEEQIKKTPDWLTPYLFSGIADANLERNSAAIERLSFVRDQAAGNPEYADADRILHLLKR